MDFAEVYMWSFCSVKQVKLSFLACLGKAFCVLVTWWTTIIWSHTATGEGELSIPFACALYAPRCDASGLTHACKRSQHVRSRASRQCVTEQIPPPESHAEHANICFKNLTQCKTGTKMTGRLLRFTNKKFRFDLCQSMTALQPAFSTELRDPSTIILRKFVPWAKRVVIWLVKNFIETVKFWQGCKFIVTFESWQQLSLTLKHNPVSCNCTCLVVMKCMIHCIFNLGVESCTLCQVSFWAARTK